MGSKFLVMPRRGNDDIEVLLADLDYFYADPDPTFEVVRIRLLIRIDFVPTFMRKKFVCGTKMTF
jgi:hypothetical protein